MKIPAGFAILVMLSLNACSSLLQHGEPVDTWRLPQTSVAPEAESAVPWQLRVTAPAAPGLLGSARIAVLPEPGRVSVYQGARWAQPAPTLLRDRLIDAFRDRGRLAAVSSGVDNLQADFVLGGSLDAFQAEYRGDTSPLVVIRYNAQLIDPSRHRILATQRFAIEEAVPGTDVTEVVAAFGRAADKLSAEIVAWTMRAGAQHWSAAHPAVVPANAEPVLDPVSSRGRL